MVSNGQNQRAALIGEAVERLRVEPDQVMELRALGAFGRGKLRTAVGYFDDMAKLVAGAMMLEDKGAKGVYIVLNRFNPALLGRYYNRIQEYPECSAADKDITRRFWLPIDVDPVRPAGVSSSETEIEHSKAVAIEAADWLRGELGDDPAVWGFSGNGHHLLFRIDLPNNDESTAFVTRIINEAADRFSTDQVQVDRTNVNAARVWKLYGTLARKGDEVPRLGRMHRRSRIMKPRFEL